jgi:site-specific DNA-methyltransferase (adenine-specific)
MGTFSVDLINAYRHNYRYSLIWEKSMSVGFLNAHKMPLRSHEDILVFYKQLPTYNPQFSVGKPYVKKSSPSGSKCYSHKPKNDLTISDGKRFPTSVLKFKSATGNNQYDQSKSSHPTQKPVDLLEYLIKTYSNEHDLILDNCAGSGSTGLACQNTKRQFILIEKNTDYYLSARQRLHNNQQRLNELLFY